MPNSEFPDTRESLLMQLQVGEDPNAWREFVSIYRPIIYRMARRRGMQDADAQDLVQQVLVSVSNAIEHWERRDESIRFRHWLRRVTRNAIYNVLTRTPLDRAAGGTSIQQRLDQEPNERCDFDREVSLEHRREVYLRAANIVRSRVTKETWEIFQMSVVHGIPVEQVSESVGKSVGTVYAARGRVMSKLRNIVEEIEASFDSEEGRS